MKSKFFQGMKFEDNTDSVQTYTAGQQVPLYFNIRAPHSGYANVSIIDTTSNSMIAANLSAWDEYALTSIPAKTEWTVCFLLLSSSTSFIYLLIFFLLFNRTSQSPSHQTSEPNAQRQANAQFKCIGMPLLLSIRHIRVVLILLLVRAAAMLHRRSEMSQRVLLLRRMGWQIPTYLSYLEDEMRR